VERMVRFGEEYDPIPANVGIFDRSFDVYKAAYHGLKERDLFGKLAGLRA
jgi:hypothetical protein